jgi:DNA polymerase-3 subunit delta
VIRPDELERHLSKQLAPVYLIGGDEPLFVQEAQDAVRAAARAAGHSERVVLEGEASFDWNRLGDAAVNLSLFGERRLIELRLPSGRPGTVGSKAISSYCSAPSPDAVLLITTGSLDNSQRTSAWAKAADRAGVFVYAWPLPIAQLPQWIARRLQRSGLRATADAIELLAARSEGNLLAAAQEIDKLRLLFDGAQLTRENVAAAVADSARYTVFDLSDAVLQGQVRRSVRILRGLREEGVEPVLVLWALARDVRVATGLAERASARDLFSREKVFGKAQQAALQQVAQRAPVAAWQELLLRAARADRVIKGIASGRPWDELVHLATKLALIAGSGSR